MSETSQLGDTTASSGFACRSEQEREETSALSESASPRDIRPSRAVTHLVYPLAGCVARLCVDVALSHAPVPGVPVTRMFGRTAEEEAAAAIMTDSVDKKAVRSIE